MSAIDCVLRPPCSGSPTEKLLSRRPPEPSEVSNDSAQTEESVDDVPSTAANPGEPG